MNKLKALLCALLAATAAFGATACGGKSSSSGSDRKDQEMAEEKKKAILDIVEKDDSGMLSGELENKTIKWMATWDINPDDTGKKTPAELLLFQEIYGGKIEYKHVEYADRYDALATAISSDEGIDFFYAGDSDAVPRGAIRNMFVPADDYIDFASPLWEDIKEANDSIMWKGKHYAAITQTTGDAVAVLYNKKTMQEAGLTDPADLYRDGQWTWDAFEQTLESFVDTSKQRYGIDGWWFEFGLMNTTGVTPVSIEGDKLVSNLGDPAMERFQNWMYGLNQKDLIAVLVGDYGSDHPNYIGEGKLLFYPVGLYELYKSADQWKATYGDDAFFVPLPRDPKADDYYIPVKLEAYSFVKGGKNPKGVAKYLDCCRYCLVNDDVHEITGAMFKDDYGWSDEMVAMRDEMQRLVNENAVIDVSRGTSEDCANILDGSLRQTARGVPWNETYDSIAGAVQQELDKINNEAK